MYHLLDNEASRKIEFFLYRYRFLGTYIVIGGLSIVLEIICFRSLEKVGLYPPTSNMLGLGIGILFAFWMNVRFNFKVPKVKRNRAFIYFVIISAGSATINFIFKKQLQNIGWSYESARFVVAGTFFLLGYFFHRRFSFADYKKVGVAVYANGVENIENIYKKIEMFPDFIHVDIFDGTLSVAQNNQNDPKVYRLETIRAYWPKKQIHIHIMSNKPSKWISETVPYADIIYVHMGIEEDINEVLELIHSYKKDAGLCITMDMPLEAIKPYLPKVNTILLLAIPNLGGSGQRFDMNTLYRIDEINNWKERNQFDLCIDGGVNEKIIGLLNVEEVISGSSVLNHEKPARQIMRLQTSSIYEKL